MKSPTLRRPGGNILLAIAAAATAALIGTTVSATYGTDSPDQGRCFSTPDAAETWISHGAALPDCAQP
jgi:hypothetical protein